VVVSDGNSVLVPGRSDVPHVVVLGFDGCDLGLFWGRGFGIFVVVPFALRAGSSSPGGCGQRRAPRGGCCVAFKRLMTGPATPPAVVLAGPVFFPFFSWYSCQDFFLGLPMAQLSESCPFGLAPPVGPF